MGHETPTGFRESDIRPDTLMKGQQERFDADMRRLLERRADFVEVPCPACGSAVRGKLFEKYGLDYVSCGKCETVYICPRPTPAILEHYYATSENYWYWNKYIFPATEDARRENIFRPRAERVKEICDRHGKAGGVLLEVGSGFGTFCAEMQRIGGFSRIIAVEPTPDLSNTCRERGIEVINKPVEQVSFGRDEIDVIVSFEVIEHLFSPRDFLIKCRDILSPGGLLVLSCPNVKGFDIMVLQALSVSVDAEHLNYFHPDSLSLLLGECGFETMEVSTPGKLDAELVRKKILSGELDVSGMPFIKYALVDMWEEAGENFQRFLADNRMSSHMWVVARKKGEEA